MGLFNWFGFGGSGTRVVGEASIAAFDAASGEVDCADPRGALGLTSIWRACQILSDAVVGLPIKITDEKSVGVKDHPSIGLLKNSASANPWMSGLDVKSAISLNVGLHGNGYAWIKRDPASNDAVEIYPLAAPDVRYAVIGGQLFYKWGSDTIRPDEMLHVKGPLTLDGLTALSPIEYHARTIGLSRALEKFAGKFFSQGGNIGGIIEMPTAMTPDAQKNFIASWKASYTGPDAAFKIAALTGGMKFHRTTADPGESQALESRVHQIREVARIYGLPPHLLADLEKSSYASFEMQNMELYTGTVQSYVLRWESEIERKMLRTTERGQLTVKLNMDSKLRGTTNERYDAYTKGRMGGWLSINDIRRKEDLPPIPNGDNYLEPLNMQPAGSVGSSASAKPKEGETK